MMTPGKIAALVFVYLLAGVGWMILGGSVTYRQNSSEALLRPKVEALWGQPITQAAPTFWAVPAPPDSPAEVVARAAHPAEPKPRALEPESTTISAGFHLNFRKKGLLWYRTYDVAFDAEYLVRNDTLEEVVLTGDVALPAERQTYDNFAFEAEGGLPAARSQEGNALWRCSVHVPAGQTAKVRLHYQTRGLDRWAYRLAPDVACVRGFRLNVTTDFGGFDFPLTSPTTPPTRTKSGYEFAWQYDTLLSGLEIAFDMPTRLNPGPLASRISFFAPVGLLFFFAVMALVGLVRDRNLHPMHYLFVCSAFFAFHLLFAYLVDLVDINVAFLTSAAVSVLLVGSYVARFMGVRFTLCTVVPAQVLFLILFSYAFFFQGYTGLTITVAAIVTLGVMMQLTARIDWDEKLGRKQAHLPPLPPGPPAGAGR